MQVKVFLPVVFLLLLALTPKKEAANTNIVEYTPENLVTLVGEVNEKSVDTLIKKILKKPQQKVVLHIDSFGGSVPAGQRLINVMQGSGKHFTCVAQNAASMAFTVLQLACQDRVAMPGAMLLSHEMLIGFQALPLTDAKKAVQDAEADYIKLQQQLADKLEMPLSELLKKNRETWIIPVEDAVRQKVIDRVGLARCSQALINDSEVEKMSFLGIEIGTVKFSKCPLIRAPEEATPAGKEPKKDKK